METTKKVLYTAKVHTTGGRANGVAKSDDGHLNIKLSTPGTGRAGTNPEQLFAGGWSACFEGAMDIVANKLRITLPVDTAIDAEVDLCLTGMDFSLQARLNISLPGMSMEVAQRLVDLSHQTCPYSKAIKGNVDVKTTITV
ncbi:organic hydroperoxide resistance protein [Niastella sp. MAH-29]|uniref:Organic hydroperoxide resistance protein n=2 Tax=Chitinophagaceae TaxID=563835 RepID=A0ABS3YRI3_9BACT|nr:organic hydroperoxide resistance protein [Niastella soli]